MRAILKVEQSQDFLKTSRKLWPNAMLRALFAHQPVHLLAGGR